MTAKPTSTPTIKGDATNTGLRFLAGLVAAGVVISALYMLYMWVKVHETLTTSYANPDWVPCAKDEVRVGGRRTGTCCLKDASDTISCPAYRTYLPGNAASQCCDFINKYAPKGSGRICSAHAMGCKLDPPSPVISPAVKADTNPTFWNWKALLGGFLGLGVAVLMFETVFGL